jgi:hypothetical protein
MNDAADNIIIKRTRRPRPPRLPASIDGYGFVGRHDDTSRAHTRIEQTVAPPLTESPGVPLVSDGGNDAKPQTVPAVPLYQGGGEGKGNRPLQGINKGATNQLIEHSEPVAKGSAQGVSSKYSGTVGTASQRDAFLKRISKLSELDEEGARAIIGDAIKVGLSSLIADSLIKPLADALGVKESAIKKFWKEVDSQAHATADSAKTTEDSTAEERARLEREELEQRKREFDAERGRLWRSCKDIAESPTLLADVEAVVHKLGVVGEGAAIRGAYLTASSRLNCASAISLLRRGAASAGKNFLITKTLGLIPADSIIHMSSGSPLSLAYYGGGDEDAVKHKVLYLAEAAILADRKASESPLAVMLRTLISEGRLDHNVALPQADGPPATKHVRRNGPVAIIITSARDNLEEEMLTRLMTSDADESPEQTLDVLADVLTKEAREVDEAEIESWLCFQRWLELSAPYDVVIPYRQAIFAAFNARLAEMQACGKGPNIQLRIRRDVHGFLAAIKTSAILHNAQRRTDSEGRIVASLDDYRHAHDAFDGGLGRLYKVKTPETTLAVVRAVETMGATRDAGIKVSVTNLMDKLGIAGRGTANDRLRDAEERGFLKLVETAAEYGRTSARVYKIGRSSEEIAKDFATGETLGAFPLPDEVLLQVRMRREDRTASHEASDADRARTARTGADGRPA